MSEKLISSINQFVKSWELEKTPEPLNLSALELKIHLEGDTWAGMVDKPVAKFLLDLDRKITEELAKAGIELPDNIHGMVALDVRAGSFDGRLEFSKEFYNIYVKLKPYVQIAIILALLTSVGVVYSPEIIAALDSSKMEEGRAKERLELVKIMGSIRDSDRELQQPIRGLVGTMSKDDVITLPAKPEKETKKTAIKQFAKGTRSQVQTFYVDHRYIVQDLSTRKPGEWVIGIKYGEVRFRAKLSITDAEIDTLLKSFQEAHARHSEISPDLQVTAEMSAKGVTAAQVIGMGPPRSGSISLGEALKKAGEPSKDAAPDDEDDDSGDFQ